MKMRAVWGVNDHVVAARDGGAVGERVAIRETIRWRRRRPGAIRIVLNGLDEVLPDASGTTRAAVTRELTHGARLERRRPSEHTRWNA